MKYRCYIDITVKVRNRTFYRVCQIPYVACSTDTVNNTIAISYLRIYDTMPYVYNINRELPINPLDV